MKIDLNKLYPWQKPKLRFHVVSEDKGTVFAEAEFSLLFSTPRWRAIIARPHIEFPFDPYDKSDAEKMEAVRRMLAHEDN